MNDKVSINPCKCGQEMNITNTMQDIHEFVITCPKCSENLTKEHYFKDGRGKGHKRYISLIDQWNKGSINGS